MTPWRSGEDRTGMTSYMYFDPETEKGVLFAFRQEECEEETLTLSLPLEGSWTFADEDTGERFTDRNGQIVLKMPEKRMARLLWAEKAK